MKIVSPLALFVLSLFVGQMSWAGSNKADAAQDNRIQCFPSSARHGVKYHCVSQEAVKNEDGVKSAKIEDGLKLSKKSQ